MNILPFICAAFLLINPVLLAVFRRFEIQLEKLQFWIMVSSGTAWIFSGILLFLNPESHLNPIWNAGEDLLPSLAFSLDWVSASLALSVCSALFYVVLTRQESPRENALLSGLSGFSVLALFADSAYSLALFWTAVELFRFSLAIPLPEQGRISNAYLAGVLVRLSAPGLLILASLTGSGTENSPFLTEWEHNAAFPLLAAGFIGFVGWFLGPLSTQEEGGGTSQSIFQAWIPASLGLVLLIRGGTVLGDAPAFSALPLVIAILLILAALGSVLLDNAKDWWFVGCGLLAAGGAALAQPASALSWGIVFMLPGSLLWSEREKAHPSILILGLAGLGTLPFPFLPAWSGSVVFREGLPGILLAAGAGIFLGALIIAVLKRLPRMKEEKAELTPLLIIGSVILTLSQVLIAFRLGLLEASRGLLSGPIAVWLTPLLAVLVLVLGNWVPLTRKDLIASRLAWFADRLRQFLSEMYSVIKRIVDLLSNLLEGDGGLIWALLFGFLLITLISLRGGR